MTQHRSESQPVRIYIPDRELSTTRRRTVAWRMTCKRCGAVGTGRYPGAALAQLRDHSCSGAANPPAPAV